MAIERIFVMTSPSRATGRCHCGNIHYSMPTEVVHHALCHCSDCRRHAGAPLVGWGLVGQDALEVSGTPKIYASSEHGRRHFCGDCGTGLFRSEEHTSELQSLMRISYAVFCLKKKKQEQPLAKS